MTIEQQQPTEKSIADLLHDLSEQAARLARTEAKLAARELAVKARRGSAGVGALAGAGVLAGFAGMALVACVILALSMVLPAWAAALLTGGVLLVLAGVVALVGKSLLRKAVPPVPDDTIARVKEDIQVVKERTQE